MTDLEDLVVAEACRQGVKPNSAVMRAVAIHLAGSKIAEGAILLPSNQSLMPRDYVASLRAAMHDQFEPLSVKPAPSANLTVNMKRKLAAKRAGRLPDDWQRVRERVTGLTARMMDEVASSRQDKQ